ncbi:DUF2259 domain-containing protein [Candidatus Fermentibacterales bacterium]|nr:DUF2259 domain-containing protein [Candidatus Fermentibacterales bacterium]
MFNYVPVPAGLALFELVGFSPGGRFLAWEQYGIQDGSGFPFCEISVMDVASCSVLARHSELYRFDEQEFFSMDVPVEWDAVLDTEEREQRFWEEYARPLARQELQPLLDSLGIVEGNTGMHLVHHPACDLTDMAAPVRFTPGLAGPGFHSGPVYELLLEQPSVEDPGIAMWEHGFMAEPSCLLLALSEQDSDSLVILVDETGGWVDPQRWAYDFSIRDVFVYRDGWIAVVLRISVPGFEGPDIEYRVVTARIPDMSPGYWYSSTG